MRPEIKEFMEALKAKTVGEAEFHQAVEEVIETVWDTRSSASVMVLRSKAPSSPSQNGQSWV